VHRLDTGTSASSSPRGPRERARLRDRVSAHDVVKRYVAIVDGVPNVGAVVDVPLAHDRTDRRRMRAARADDRAWPAETTIVAVDPYGLTRLVHGRDPYAA
jgi:23S rRNA-/tRNA-specific pseudouridylate synthase